jgi:hypothetical protein
MDLKRLPVTTFGREGGDEVFSEIRLADWRHPYPARRSRGTFIDKALHPTGVRWFEEVHPQP